MKNHIHRIAKYTALILISAMPFSADVLADSEKDQNEIATLKFVENDVILPKRNLLGEESE